MGFRVRVVVGLGFRVRVVVGLGFRVVGFRVRVVVGLGFRVVVLVVWGGRGFIGSWCSRIKRKLQKPTSWRLQHP